MMLTHPTLDRLHELGLQGMARAFAELHDNADAADLAFEDRLGLMLDREADLRATKPGCVRPSYASRPRSRTSTSARHAASTKPCSSASPTAAGSLPGTTC
jgi:hypothetical protein